MKITRKKLQKIIREETLAVVSEGLLEDPIEQSDSIILSAIDGQGFKTPGFMDSIVSSIKMTADRLGTDPIAEAEKELDKMHKGLDDLADRISRRLMTYFPRGAASQRATDTELT